MRKRGFSLTETILAFGLVAWVLVLVLELIPSSLYLAKAQERQQRAAVLARSLLAVQADRLAADWEAPLPQPSPVTEAGITYNLTTALENPPAGSPAGLKRLAVSVRWTYRSQERNLTRAWLVRPLRAVPK